MGCPRKTYLGDYIAFGICTHDPTTGLLTNADSLPIYRIYEDEVAFPLLVGTMTQLDESNTTGFYSENVRCDRQNGFDVDKTYTIYIEATVDSDTGGMCYGFVIKANSNWKRGMIEGINTVDNSFHQIIGRVRNT
jgi:hypothetical protein